RVGSRGRPCHENVGIYLVLHGESRNTVIGVERRRSSSFGPRWPPVDPRPETPRQLGRPRHLVNEHTLSVTDAAARLGCSPATVRRRIEAGEIDAYPHRGTWRVVASALAPPPPAAHASDSDPT